MADEDMFMDNERLQKMIALGIYDDKTVDKMKNIKNSDFKDTDISVRPSAPDRSQQRPDQTTHPKPQVRQQFRNERTVLSGQQSGHWRPPNANRGRFQPLANSAYKWSEFGDNRDKRPRSPSGDRNKDEFRDGFRSGIRDGIQTKIRRNEIETKLNDDFNRDRNSGNSCFDTDLRPKADTDSRIRDTDYRSADNQIISGRTADNLQLITSTANDEDFRAQEGGGDDRRGGRMGPNSQPFRGHQRPGFSGGDRGPNPKPMIDDLDDFISKAEMRLNLKPSPTKGRGGQSGRGRGSDLRSNPTQRPDNSYNINNRNDITDSYSRPTNESQNSFSSRFERRPEESEPREEMTEPTEESEANPSKHIAILRETVEELAKSNLFCQYCDCYLSSLVEVNSHIGTLSHQQNMAKKIMEDNDKERNSDNTNDSKPVGENRNESAQPNRTVTKTIVERVPIGMAALTQMIEQKKQITLKSLTEMDSYEISSDCEASLAKELAKLLTNELLNYKMNLMPDNVREALKHQGIGLMNSMANSVANN